MTRYVGLLRGINVGGVRIKMADLRDSMTALGYSDVKTVLASGNIVFESRKKAATVTTELESALGERFGYGARVLIVTTEQLQSVVDAYPFAARDGWHSYVIFCSEDALVGQLLDKGDDLDPTQEQIAGGDSVVYWQVERGQTLDSGFGKATGKVIPKRPDSPFVTNRNLNTLHKLL
ncbi:DUF1697 domain-containing protein [Jongsikchunia kroppenstedtii]|uniref:DUF1697 domain-containing protein n=1 Tax=Jongsikchunia kroppenstedtii TaxID=1121721 RepID=UPI000368A35D|nr:DUF1697 domain-containing protein [Jongsikchunia kroppenstedtii]